MKKSFLATTMLTAFLSVNLVTTGVSAATSIPENTYTTQQTANDYLPFALTPSPYYSSLVVGTPMADNVIANSVSTQSTEITLTINTEYLNSKETWIEYFPEYGGVEKFPVDMTTGNVVIKPEHGFLQSLAPNSVSLAQDGIRSIDLFSFIVTQ